MPSYKRGVDFSEMSKHITERLSDIDRVHQLVVGRKAVITSGRDGKHKTNSLHYAGKAIDIRTRDLKKSLVQKLARALRSKLGGKFDVVVETDHIHIEFDPK